MARPGAAVLTGSGQELLAGGASLGDALAMQAPHFRGGGRVTPGRYASTAYGPPWGGINGIGVTRTGVDLRPAKRAYGVAVDPRMIGLGSSVFAWPNPFGYTGAFRAFDTGGAIQGRRLDFYDWRGRKSQMGWGKRNVNVSGSRLERRPGEQGTQFSASGGAAAAPRVRILGPSRRRSGLIQDALTQGISAGAEGLTRAAITREGNPFLGTIREATRAATSTQRASRYRPPSSAGGGGGAGGLKPGGGWGGSEALVRAAIRGYSASSLKRPTDSVAGPAMSDHYVGNKLAFAADLPPGDSVFNTVRRRLGIPARSGTYTRHRIPSARSYGAQLLWRVANHNWGDNPHVHLGIRRMRAGGLVGGNLRAPGAGRRLSRGANRALDFRAGSMEALDELLGSALQGRLFKLSTALTRAVRAGGPERIVQRLQGMLSNVEFELGRRIGVTLDRVAKRAGRSERAGGSLDRALRREGVDPGSVAGLQRSIALGESTLIPNAQRNLGNLRGALATAKRTGNRGAIRDLTERVRTAETELWEAVTVQAERSRDLATALRAAALEARQTGVDIAAHGSTLASTGLRRLEVEQRLAGTFESGAVARANFIRQTIVPALNTELAALREQAAELQRQGLAAELRAVLEGIAAKELEVLEAQLEAQEQTAENTEPRGFGGTLGFSFGGEGLTDSLVTIGNGV
jgi:3D (Asp-Asp-Asp) domain-containing protein